MEPLPETAEAIRALSVQGDDQGLVATLVRLAGRVREVVPDLIGLSLARIDEGLTFTVVASAAQVAVLDAVQYLGGGPCVEGAHSGAVQTFEVGDPLDEERWRFFSELTAADSVRSTLTLPLIANGSDGLAGSMGSVNLYAASGRAFVGHHEKLAAILGGWAEGAVTNADLSFSTREFARKAPRRVEEIRSVNEAVGLLAGRFGVDISAAEGRLLEAAARAGVTVPELAHFLVRAHEESLRHDDRRADPSGGASGGAQPD